MTVYSRKTIEIDGKEVEVFEKTSGELGNTLTVEAGTNGFCDTNYFNTRTHFMIGKSGNGFGAFSIELFGDEGLRDCIEALEFALNVLKNQSSYDSK